MRHSLDTDNNNEVSLKFYLSQPGKDTSGTLTKPGIFFAAYNDQQDVVQYLLSLGAHVTDVREAALTHVIERYNNQYPNGTPFIVACETANQEDVKFFVEYYLNDHNGNESLDAFINQLGKDSDG